MKLKNLSEKILRLIKSEGFKNIELDPVLETKYILQRSGENFKRLLFSFYDLNGKELCLRPDLTISSVLRFIQNKKIKKDKVCYSGGAFRKTYQKKDSIIKNQIGFEILGSNDKQKEDREIIETSIKLLNNSGFKRAVLKIGNVELFNLLVKKLDIPRRWKIRLKRYYWNEKYFNELLKRLETNSDIDPVFVEIDKSRFIKMRKDNQNKIIAGRTFKEILDRFDMKIKDPRRASSGKTNTKIIKEFLKVKCKLENAPERLNIFFKKHNLNIVVGKEFFPINKLNNKNLKIEFSTSLPLEAEFYSSMIFSIEVKKGLKFRNFISGGRYDQLTNSLGFKSVPAVGAAIDMNVYD
jgi:ATP phosphoribosyltransferase regulatory subunit|tara:strand:- start:855 stop:1910 length:1056 start_codon:yes stop_codon:yes gene_type:complete